MSTWVKQTSKAIYLMQGNQWISRITKRPSKTNPDEKVLDIEACREWFLREDRPRAMTVSWDDESEPEKKPAPPQPKYWFQTSKYWPHTGR